MGMTMGMNAAPTAPNSGCGCRHYGAFGVCPRQEWEHLSKTDKPSPEN